MRIYIYKYKRSIKESGHDDPYVMFTDFRLKQVKIFVRDRFKGSLYFSILQFCMRIYIRKSGHTCHSLLTLDSGRYCMVKIFVRDRFQNSLYSSILKISISTTGIYMNQVMMIHMSLFTDFRIGKFL